MMKRAFLLAVTALAALLATSCQKEELGRILTATIEQYESNSKAYINSDYYACWENNDTVNINGVKYPIRIASGEGQPSTATIQGTENLTERPLLAYYPASGVSSWSGDNVTISLPQMQTYHELNGHQIIDNPMAAYCPAGSNELKFRNLGALLKVTIQAGANDLPIKTIQVKGDNDQMLWGTAQLTLDYQNQPILSKMSNGGTSVSLSFEKHPVVISANSSKNFYIVVPAASTFFDFTIHIAAAEQGIYKKESKLGKSLQRNHIGALTYAPADNEKVNNEILYTGSIENHWTGIFGDAQVEEVGDGFILFDISLTTIGKNAFKGCSGLTSIDLPAGVTSIGYYAFKGCSSLTSIDLPAGVTSIGEYTFKGCSSLTSIDLPAGVTSIGNYAFDSCSGLTSIDLSHTGVTSIGVSAFSDCSNLSSISLPAEVTSIGNDAFSGCSGLTSIDLSHTGVTSIGGFAFSGCSGLASIALPAGVTSIGYYTFRNCYSLARVDCYATTPPSLGASAFEGINSSAELHVPRECSGNYSGWRSFFGGDIFDDLPSNL